MSFLRLMGVGAFAVCGWCAGDAVRIRIQEHLNALTETIGLLQELEQEIAFRRTDLRVLGQRLVRERRLCMENQTIQSALPPSSFTGVEADCFRECFSGLGHAEADEECRRLAFYRERFAVFWQQSQTSAQEKMLLAQKLGVAAGLAIGILFL